MAELFYSLAGRPAGPVLRITFVQYLIAFCSRPEVTRDVISGANVGLVGLEVHVIFFVILGQTVLEV